MPPAASRRTTEQAVAARALAVQLGLAVLATVLAAGYLISSAGWLAPPAGAAVLASMAAAAISFPRVRAESRELNHAEDSLRALIPPPGTAPVRPPHRPVREVDGPGSG